MRSILIYGSIFLVCLIISIASADKKLDDENGDSKRTKKAKNKALVNKEDGNSSEEHIKYKGKNSKVNSDEKPKKFIGRIERGKVLVLKHKKVEDSEEKVCHKNNKNCYQEDSDEEDNSSEEPKRKIKYSIKFKHEKQQNKHKNNNEEMRIMKLHKNELKQYGKEDPDDDEDSEEDDRPYKKRLRFDEDD